ncbi:hypothetical protein C8R44DRAFT_866369 [Mycena epipterygia]|nr:hypothetical protein C8R44DRAFT_866369 [Mycena epipterygia]
MYSSRDVPIPHIHVVHPGNQATFKAFATSTKKIRATRGAMLVGCTNCLKNDGDDSELTMRRCGKCKGAWYCSKECQTGHWPTHKQVCSKLDGYSISKLVQTLYSNPVLKSNLQACFVLHFDLLRHAQLDKPFRARVDIGIEPADMVDFFNIFNGQPPANNLLGMVQVNAFTPLPPVTLAGLTPMHRESWRQTREHADKMGYRGDSVGLLEFGNGDETFMLAVHIQSHALELVKASPPLVMKSAITGKVTQKSFNIETCMEFMNTHIRADKKNQLLLRTDMRPSDIQIIRAAGTGSDRSAARILKAKMAREQIFTPVMVKQDSAGRISLV